MACQMEGSRERNLLIGAAFCAIAGLSIIVIPSYGTQLHASQAVPKVAVPISSATTLTHAQPMHLHRPTEVAQSSTGRTKTKQEVNYSSKVSLPTWLAAVVSVVGTAIAVSWHRRVNRQPQMAWALMAMSTADIASADEAPLLSFDSLDSLSYDDLVNQSARPSPQASFGAPDFFGLGKLPKAPVPAPQVPEPPAAVTQAPKAIEEVIAQAPRVVEKTITKAPEVVQEVVAKAPKVVEEAVVKAPKVVEEVVARAPKVVEKVIVEAPKAVEEAVTKAPAAVPELPSTESLEDLYDSLIKRPAVTGGAPKAPSLELDLPSPSFDFSKALGAKDEALNAMTEKLSKLTEPAAETFSKKAQSLSSSAPAIDTSGLDEATKAVREATGEVLKTFEMLQQAINGSAAKVSGAVSQLPANPDQLLVAYQAQVQAIQAQLPEALQPLVPMDPLVGAGEVTLLLAVVLGIPAWTLYNLRYGGYSGDLSPEEVQAMLLETNALLLDIRSSEEAEDGVPDLRRAARARAVQLPPEQLPPAVRRKTRDVVKVERALQALTASSLKRVQGAKSVIVMDRNGSVGRAFARELRSNGIKKVYALNGGFEGWQKGGLSTRDAYQVTDLADLLKQEVEALAAADDNVLGRLNAFVSSDKGKVYIGIGVGISALVLANLDTVLQLAALAAASKIGVDVITDRSYAKPRVGPNGDALKQPEEPKTGWAKIQAAAAGTIEQAKGLQQSIAANLQSILPPPPAYEEDEEEVASVSAQGTSHSSAPQSATSHETPAAASNPIEAVAQVDKSPEAPNTTKAAETSDADKSLERV